MAIERVERTCNQSGASKILYLASVTLATASFIVGCILIHLVVVPYTEERYFVPTECRYLRSSQEAEFRSCENICSKGNSEFPCLGINVIYKNQFGKRFVGFLYDYYRTYNLFKKFHCSSSPCNTRQADNIAWVQAFNRSLYDMRRFPCYFSLKNSAEVLLHKLHPQRLMLHSVIWPAVICILSITVCLFTWCCAGCSVWTQDGIMLN